MIYALETDTNGIVVGSHVYPDGFTVPTGYISCTKEQFGVAGTLQVVNGQITESLQAAKTAQIALLKAGYQTAINAPVTFKNAAGVTSTYPSGNTILITGDKAKSLLAETIAAGSAAWTLGKWLDTNDVAQTFTFSDLQGLAAAMEAAVTASYETLVSKIAQVNAATTVAEVQAVTW